MFKAVIDIGTNSIKAVIASVLEEGIDILEDINRAPRLGEKLAESGQIGAEAMQRNLSALREIRDICQKRRVEKVQCVGAETLRKAKDADLFKQMVLEELGWELRTLRPEEEARLTFLASVEMAPKGVPALVVDSGGGSTEFSFGDRVSIEARHSLPLGAVTLTQQFIHNDPPKAEELSLLAEHIRKMLRDQLPQREPLFTIACGGTLTTLAAVGLGLDSFDPDKVQGYLLTRQELARQKNLFRDLDNEGRKGIKGMPASRADIILAGAMIAAGILEHFTLEGVRVSTYGLRHTLLWEDLP
ncbi:MAG: Ppx/GppA family phosphatase [Candidatus Syntrophosphaera sp.]|nr:Ppx/GppA family phosphatase [Candidatus Syntrophosphaera sp.]